MDEQVSSTPSPVPDSPSTDRRDFLTKASTVTMAGGLAAGYGTLGAMGVGFLYPTGSSVGWQFAAIVKDLREGESMTYVSPSGAKVVIARQSKGDEAEDFIALSSVCPHLGCAVHWEAHNDRFFCPCHNGVFDPQGNPVEGPPKDGNQPLTRFPLKVENGLLFIEAPVKSVGRQVADASAIRDDKQAT